MAKLDLPEDERRELKLRAELFLKMCSPLANADTEGAEPLVSVLDFNSVLREDTAGQMLAREALLTNAPEQYDGYFQVPKTLD
jgi:aspartyl-tRNA(Asn)/glutamyl-tRNA(Gln) amidotransferase subunit C